MNKVKGNLSSGASVNIDRAMLGEAMNEYYDLNTAGVIVLKGKRLYGIAFEYETISW